MKKTTTTIRTLIAAAALAAMCIGLSGTVHADPDSEDVAALARGLGLSADQRAKVRAIQDDLRKSQARLRAAIEVASIDLRRELDAESPSEGKVGPLVEKVAQLEGKLRKEHILAMIRIKKLLTPDQRAQLERLQARPNPWGVKAPAPPAPPAPPTPPTGITNPFEKHKHDHDCDDCGDWDRDYDFDFDFEFDGDDFSAEVRREIEREISEAQREAKRAQREAMREAKRAMKQAQREAARARAEAQREAQEALREAQRELDKHRRSYSRIHRRSNSDGHGKGKIKLNATRPAQIYIDGKKIGWTPLVTRLSPGRHDVTARWQGKPDKKLTIVVNEGDTVDVLLRPAD